MMVTFASYVSHIDIHAWLRWNSKLVTLAFNDGHVNIE